MCNPENKSWWKFFNGRWGFALFWLIVTGVTIGFVLWQSDRFEHRQQLIVNGYAAQIHRTDSVLSQNRELILLHLTQRDSTAYTQLPRLEQRLAKEDAILTAQDNLHVMELELAKIQHEYEALELWGALLTIVFLIFSFYSLYKSDELARDSRAALSEITGVKKDVDERKKDIDSSAIEIHKKYQDKFDEFAKTVDDRLKGVDGVLETKVSGMNKQLETHRLAMETQLRQLRTSLEEISELQSINVERDSVANPSAEQLARERDEEELQQAEDSKNEADESSVTRDEKTEQ